MADKAETYNSVLVAEYIAALVNKSGLGINMTKLQKLLYIVYGTYLALKGDRLVNEHPQAWPYGPVFPTVRNKLLKKDMTSISFDDLRFHEIKKDVYLGNVIRLVLDSFGNKNATTLTVWSHQEGSPWSRVSSQEGFTWGMIIPDEYIKEYFNSILIRNGGK